tara:strand:+ start:69 stop:314 length:246 start_codon:yes stop_codon:yes gene_type:complete
MRNKSIEQQIVSELIIIRFIELLEQKAPMDTQIPWIEREMTLQQACDLAKITADHIAAFQAGVWDLHDLQFTHLNNDEQNT